MLSRSPWHLFSIFAILCLLACHDAGAQQTAEEVTTIEINDQLVASAPAAWEPREPRSQMLAYEFAIPSNEADTPDVRVTMMTAGGGVRANFDRWTGQFSKRDGEPKTETSKKHGHSIHTIDLSGTYQDRKGGPFGPAVARENYRMQGVIVEGEGQSFFVKAYGPKSVMEAHQDALAEFLDSIAPAK